MESDERKFLHDIAGPLATAMILIDIVQENLEKDSSSASRDLGHIKKVGHELQRLRTMLSDRRQVLIQRGVPSSKNDNSEGS